MSEIAIALDYEQEFASHLCDKDALVYFMQEGISLDLLYSTLVKSIYAFAQTEFERSKTAPTLDMLRDEFSSFQFVEPSSTPGWIADKLRERYRRNVVQETVRAVALLSEQPDEAFDYLRSRLFEVEMATTSRRYLYSPEDVHLLHDRYLSDIEAGFFKGVTCGFSEVDKRTGGFRPGNLIFLAARPKRFKTFFLLMAFVKQVLAGEKVMLDTLELTVPEVWVRLICLLSYIELGPGSLSFDRAVKGMLEPKEFKLFKELGDYFGKNYDWHIYSPPVGERTVPRLLLEADKVGATSVIIDQLSFLEGRKDRYDADHLKYKEIVYDLKNAATKSGSERPFYVAAQINREGANLSEMADAAKVALTGAVEQACDALYGLHRTKQMYESGQVEFGVIEARNHDIGSWQVQVELRRHTQFEIVSENG